MVIKIFSIPDCPYCLELKNLLTDMGIEFTDIDVSLPENENEFKQIIAVSGNELVPSITVGKHLLAPDLNFSTIKEASEIVKFILETEKD